MQAKEVVRAVYADFARGDVEAVLARFHPEIEFRLAEHHLYDRSGEGWIGPDAIAQNFFARIGDDWERFTVAPRIWHAAGDDVVVVEGRYAGEHRGTGRALDMQFCHVWELDGGQVVRFQQYTDTAHLRDVAGARESAELAR
jgi:ketosteroid isomerase-like protein